MTDQRWKQATETIAKSLGRELSPLGYSQTLEDCAVEIAALKKCVKATKALQDIAMLAKQCPYYSRAWGCRCELEAGHQGWCCSQGDGFKPGYKPQS